jgi:acyl-CoA thioester hydrolase
LTGDFKTSLQLRVDWADLDLFGHVNNVAFFRFFQAARVSYCDKIGLSSLNLTPVSFMVASSQCQFIKAIGYPDHIQVYTKAEHLKNTSFRLSHLITNSKNEVCADGADIIVVYDHSAKKKISIPDQVRKAIELIENGSALK